MSKKGVSLEEKRKRILSIFHDSGEMYQLKDIEKIGSKKGIVSQSIKDILMSLVDDNLVTTDKIGTSNYFWSYPSAALKVKQVQLDELEKKIEKEKAKKERLESMITELMKGREENDERKDLLRQWMKEETRNKQLKTELTQYKANDPLVLEEKEKMINVAKEAANRWTENIWEIQSYCVNKFGMDRTAFNQSFGIDDDFDTIP
ncbi:meiotic nuclear division protein 1 [Pilobolus umbonatus]|nr:meiotic nuclear division protein 1 [Pilobolus umbonatus]